MWVVDMQKTLDVADLPAAAEKWPRHCIFRVPPRFRTVHGGVYKPQTVALGPFHHGDPDLAPMEAHKRRAVARLLRRAGRTLADLAASVEEVAEDLEDAYAGLGGEWRGENRGRFLEMMVADGCFLLEVMRRRSGDYATADPVFSRHAVGHIAPFVQRDMLMVENQLPLLLLHRIAAVEGGEASDESSINREILKFLGVGAGDARAGPSPTMVVLHPLDLYRRSLFGTLYNHKKEALADPSTVARAAPRSAQRLWEAGVRFRCRPGVLDDIEFDNGRRRLEMPEVALDDSTEYKFHNMMAFEALHGGGATGNDVTAFVLFMRDMVDSAGDVALLAREGILWHDLAGGDAAVAGLFDGLTRDVAKTGESRLCAVRDRVERYCNESWRVFVFESWAKLRNTYFTSLWASVALTVSVFLLITDVMQTAYAVMSYELTKHRHG
ncbi:hypothetical protein SEVIR_8G154100v4 [Setaria viridis]|nr:UPF0481 protein At3g47200-like [Setaria viridis]